MPTAMLPYCGRTLLEGLVRDLEVKGIFWDLANSWSIDPNRTIESSRASDDLFCS